MSAAVSGSTKNVGDVLADVLGLGVPDEVQLGPVRPEDAPVGAHPAQADRGVIEELSQLLVALGQSHLALAFHPLRCTGFASVAGICTQRAAGRRGAAESAAQVTRFVDCSSPWLPARAAFKPETPNTPWHEGCLSYRKRASREFVASTAPDRRRGSQLVIPVRDGSGEVSHVEGVRDWNSATGNPGPVYGGFRETKSTQEANVGPLEIGVGLGDRERRGRRGGGASVPRPPGPRRERPIRTEHARRDGQEVQQMPRDAIKRHVADEGPSGSARFGAGSRHAKVLRESDCHSEILLRPSVDPHAAPEEAASGMPQSPSIPSCRASRSVLASWWFTHVGRAAASRMRFAGAATARRLRAIWSHRAARIACPIVATLMLLPPAAVVHHVYFDRSGLPDLDAFIRFEPPTIGRGHDAAGRS